MKLRYYESFYLLRPDLSEEDRAALTDKLQAIITEKGGQVAEVDLWPLRKLAYRVEKQTQGYYVLLEYGATADVISELTRAMRIDERVMKFMTLKKGDSFDPEAIARSVGPAPEPESEAFDITEEAGPESGFAEESPSQV